MLTLFIISACWLPVQAEEAPPPAVEAEAPPSRVPVGPWRAWLDSPGGELPFGLELTNQRTGWRAWVINGPERSEIMMVNVLDDKKIIIAFDHYDAAIVGELSADARRFDGTWQKRGKDKKLTRLPVHATAGAALRFSPESAAGATPAAAPGGAIDGRWAVKFEKSTDPAVGLFRNENDGTVSGTFETTGGDYRYLVGAFQNGRLRLSTFDGAHAFLVHARIEPDGTLKGEFWSGESWHETWTARRDEQAQLPDGFARTRATCDVNFAELKFKDTLGAERSLNAPELAGKARILELFGSWCPNCHDAADLLVELDHRYRSRGLSIAGLAFELSGEHARDARQVRTFAARHGIEYPLLVAGPADKEKVSTLLPFLDGFQAYPTTVFVTAEGQVRAVHTGFSGPATGEDYKRLRARFEAIIEEMLAGAAEDDEPHTEAPGREGR
ncbi:MAG: TlpA family protein disulfide reductase [Planctomycetes bacterium]|nr:TlpA family protein disulfide reductase [Planctomycetota bacterium]